MEFSYWSSLMSRYPQILAMLAALVLPAVAGAQDAEFGLILQVEGIADAVEIANDADDDDLDASREVTVEVKHDDKTITVTQTVDGEFVGEIASGEDTKAIRAESLDELKEKSPEAHAAFTQKPVIPAAKPGVPTSIKASVSINNGARKVDIEEAGRKVTMRDQMGKQIGITIRQDVEHGTRTERVDAADQEALKKFAPELAQLLEKYVGENGAGQLQMQAVQGRLNRFQGTAIVGPRKIFGEHDGRKVSIKDENGRNIRMTISKTVDGKEVVEEIKADDLADLKSKNAEWADVYEKLAGKGQPQAQNQLGNGNVIIGNAGVPVRIQVQAQPIVVQAVPEVEELPVPAVARDLANLKTVLEMSRKKMERMANDPKFVDRDAARKLTDDLAGMLEKLKDLEAKTKP